MPPNAVLFVVNAPFLIKASTFWNQIVDKMTTNKQKNDYDK